MQATCSVDGCEKVGKKRGWCENHYWRWRVYGTTDPNAPRAPRRGVCSIEDCAEPVRTRQLCSKHYSAWYRQANTRPAGQPAGPGYRLDPHERIERRPDGCWIWTGSLDRDGYGRIKIHEKWNAAHRWFYADAHGPIPDGLDIDHLCFVRPCVNPEHLEAVTRSENSIRMWAARGHAS